MTPPRSIVDNLSANRILGRPWLRRVLFGVAAVILAVLTLVPREYRAAVSLTPTDPSSLGLSGALGQLGALTNVFGSQAAVEISLKVARSVEVRRLVINRLGLIKSGRFKNEEEAQRWLDREVDIRSLRGGILQISTKMDDPVLAKSLVGALADSIRNRLAEIAQAQTAYKRRVLEKLVGDAGDRYARAQTAYDAFRRRTRYSDPGTSIEAIGQRIPDIQAAIKAREVDLRAAQQFGTGQSFAVQQIEAEIAALRSQLREAESLDASSPESVNRVVIESTQVEKLARELNIARSLYVSYQRFLEGTSAEDLASGANVRILEPPFIDPAIQFRTLPLALLMLVLLVWAVTELYQMRPPVGANPRYLRAA
jgi:tyrosine-protein kinase Etk/Wzc